jgi:hypothetical protein
MSSTTENRLSSFICRYCDMSLIDEQSWNLHEQKHLLQSELEDENSFIIPDRDTSNNDISITSSNNDSSNSPTNSFVIKDLQSTNNLISYQTNYDKSPTNSDISNNIIIPDNSPTNDFIIPDNSPTNFNKQRPRNNRFVLNEPTKNVKILPKQPSTERRLKFCQHCNKTFFTVVALQQHLQKNHPQLENNNKNQNQNNQNAWKGPTNNDINKTRPKFFVDYKSSNQNQNSTLTNQQQQHFQGIQQQQQPKQQQQQQHFQGIHSIKRCRYCNLPFVTDKALRQHEKKHIARTTQPATTMSKPQLEAIIRTSTATTRPLIATKKYQQQPQGIKLCRYCKLPFVTDTALEKHEQKHIFQNPQFKMAQQTTTTTLTTTQQQSTSSNGKVFRYILKPLNGATVQQTTVEHECKFCQTKHQSYDKLLGHIALRHFPEMFESSGWKCSFCSNKFESEKIMLSHIVRAHDILGPMISIMGKKKKKVKKSNLIKLGRF